MDVVDEYQDKINVLSKQELKCTMIFQLYGKLYNNYVCNVKMLTRN